MNKGRCFVVSCGLLLLASGCQRGPSLGTVSGVVTLNGQPIEQATVTFTPAQGQASFARTKADGSYQLQFADSRPGAMLGAHVVSIETYRVAVDEHDNVVEHPETLPAKYNVESDLTRTVEPGENVFDFQLTTD